MLKERKGVNVKLLKRVRKSAEEVRLLSNNQLINDHLLMYKHHIEL